MTIQGRPVVIITRREYELASVWVSPADAVKLIRERKLTAKPG